MHLEQELERLEAEKALYQELLKSRGWAQLVNEIRVLARQKEKEVLQSDDEGLNGLIETAKSKSELAGIQFVINYAAARLAETEESLAEIREALREESENAAI